MKRFVLAALLLVAASQASALNLSGREVVIPIAGRLPGAFGTTWRTDLVVTNPSSHREVSGEIVFHAAGGGDQRMPFALAPRASATYRDLLGSLGDENVQGVIRVIADDRSITARARVYNAGHPAGEFGQDVPGVPIEQLAAYTMISALSAADGNRANVGISNPHDRPADVSVSWFDGDGEFRGAAMFITIPARGVLTINDIFDWTGQPRDTKLSIFVRASDPSRPVYLWGSVVRNDTGDAVFIAGHDVLD